jgi:hypothetical protein
MSDFVPRPVPLPSHFDIEHDRHGHWIARDRDGLAGGTFVTRQAAVRFALSETGGNKSHVHLLRRPADLSSDYRAGRPPISRRQNPPGQSIRPIAR